MSVLIEGYEVFVIDEVLNYGGFFGGTTAIWGGRCAELDPIDLERRDYVPHSGWPIGWKELERWYEQAKTRLAVESTTATD